MTELFRTDTQSTPLFFPYNEDESDDKRYAENIASILGEDSVDDVRQRQLADAEEDILQATVNNLSNPDMDAQTRSFAESYAMTNQALSWYSKYLKDSQVMNKELADRKTGELFERKPQTFLNALTERPEDFEDVSMFDNRIYDINTTISEKIPDPQWDLKMYGRVARDFTFDLVGNWFFKGKGGVVRQLTGNVLTSTGLGHALDMAALDGDSVYIAQQNARNMYLEAVSAKPEEYEAKKQDLIEYVLSIPSQYRADILQAIDEGPSIYADAGAAATAHGVMASGKMVAKGAGFIYKGGNKIFEKVVQSRKKTPNNSVPPSATVDEVADAVDERKKSTALVPYRDHSVTVVGEDYNDTLLSLEDKTFPTYYLPGGQKVTVIAPPEKRLSLPKPVDYSNRLTHWSETQIRTVGLESYGHNVKREWLPEARRIRFTYDNNGRGYTKEEVEQLARDAQRVAYNALNESKKAKWVYDVEKEELVQTNRQLRSFIPVSAAARDTFLRAEYNLDTAGKAEGGAMYGAGPYASRDMYEGDAASRGHYSPALDIKDVEDSLKSNIEKYSDKYLKGSNDIDDDIFKRKYKNNQINMVKRAISSKMYSLIKGSTQGLADIYTELKNLLDNADEHLDKAHSPVDENGYKEVKNLYKAVLKGMIKEYSKKKTSVINNWMLRDFDSDFGIGQREVWGDMPHGYLDQSPTIQRKLRKVCAGISKDLEDVGVIVPSKVTPEGYRVKMASEKTAEELFNSLAFKKLFPLEAREVAVPNVEKAEVLSYYHPFYVRADFGAISVEDLERFGITDEFLENPSSVITPEMEEFKRYVRVNALIRFAQDLEKNGIRYGAQASTNFVVFQNKPSMYSNVFKQEYNLKGVHTQKVLDNGGVIRYDPEIRGYVLDYYITTPGRGRKPVIIHKQPLKEFDPKYTEKDKE